MATVSIIVPVYNAEKYIKTCVESVLNQSFTDIELILIDDGSKDTSGRICDEYAARDARIVVMHNENSGPSAARNAGLDAASGEWIMFLDSDDWIEPDCLKELIAAVKTNTAILQFLFDDCKMSNTMNHAGEVEPRDALVRMIEGSDGMGYIWNKLYRKRIINGIRFNEQFKMSEDILFNAEVFHVLRQEQRIQFLNKVIYHHIANPQSLVNDPKYIGRYPDMIRAFELIKEQSNAQNDEELNNQIVNAMVETAALCLTRITALKTKNAKEHIELYRNCIRRNYLVFCRTSRETISHKAFVWSLSCNAYIRTWFVNRRIARKR